MNMKYEFKLTNIVSCGTFLYHWNDRRDIRLEVNRSLQFNTMSINTYIRYVGIELNNIVQILIFLVLYFTINISMHSTFWLPSHVNAIAHCICMLCKQECIHMIIFTISIWEIICIFNVFKQCNIKLILLIN